MSRHCVSRRRMLAVVGAATTLAGCSEQESPEEQKADIIYVATDGSDDNRGSEDAPLASINDAVSQADPGNTVEVLAGEYVEHVVFHKGGESGLPITLTGSSDAILQPPADAPQAISVGASYVHIRGLTVTGLQNPDAPDDPSSYHPSKLIDLNTFAESHDDYIEGLVISPNRIGNAGGSLINSQMIRDSEIGNFKVIGPAGARWVLDDTDGHNGEFVYLGTAENNRLDRGYDTYDQTRNVRVHHIDNSDGHPHSELVDCKNGTENITIEYCTDAGGSQTHISPDSRAIYLNGQDCTVRWNIIQDVVGNGVTIGPQGYMSDLDWMGEPETELEYEMGKDHEIYGNMFTGCTFDAIDLLQESEAPGRDSNPLPEDQSALCDNLYDGYSDGDPDSSCSASLPTSDGIGHLGGESPWDGDVPTAEDVFAEDATSKLLEVTTDAGTVSTNSEIEVTVTVTNKGDSTKDVTVAFRRGDSILTEESISISAGVEQAVTLTYSGQPVAGEIDIIRNGQKVDRVRILDD